MTRRASGVRAVALALVAALAAACSSGGTPNAQPSSSIGPSVSPKPSAKPTVKKSPSAKPSPSHSPSPSPSPSAKPTGTPVSAAGSALRFVPPSGEAIEADTDCATIYPELFDVSCDDVRLDGGSVMWVAGTEGGRWTLRLHAFSEAAGGYQLRFRADDPDGAWSGFRLGATPLAGYGTDGLVVATLFSGEDEKRSYDVLTWRKGGPLVLRAHRAKLPHGRVLLGKGYVDEYAGMTARGEAPCCPSRFVRRRLAWDGQRFLLATLGAVAPDKVPPGD